MHNNPLELRATASTSGAADATKIIPSASLFGSQREVWIEHDGVRYRLRITRRNKLILQK